LRYITTVLLVFMAIVVSSWSAADQGDIVIGTSHTIHSEVLDEERTFSVYVPPGYEGSDLKYPLLVTLDGYFVAPVGVVDYLGGTGNIPRMIVVAVDSTDRDRDFTPTRAKDLHGELLPTSGGAPDFARFLSDELIPHLEARYRLEDYRIIAGHSLGGLFATYVLLEKPGLFQAYYAASPTLPWDGRWVERRAKTALRLAYDRPVFFSLIMDSQTGRMADDSRRFVDVLKTANSINLEWKFETYTEEDHISCFLIGFYDALRSLYHDYKIPGSMIEAGDAEGIERHYRALSTRFGYEMTPTWSFLDWIANWHRLMHRQREALALYRLATQYFPESSAAHQRVGEVCELNGDLDQAIEAYRRALAYATGPEQVEIVKGCIARVEAERSSDAANVS